MGIRLVFITGLGGTGKSTLKLRPPQVEAAVIGLAGYYFNHFSSFSPLDLSLKRVA